MPEVVSSKKNGKKKSDSCCNRKNSTKPKPDKNKLKTIPSPETLQRREEREANKEEPKTYDQACTESCIYRVECKDGMIIKHMGRRVSDKVFQFIKPYQPCKTGGFIREKGGCVMVPLRFEPKEELLITEGCTLKNIGEVLEETKSFIEPDLLRPPGRTGRESDMGGNLLYPVEEITQPSPVGSEEHPPYPIYHDTGTPEIMLREDVFGVIQDKTNPAEDIYVMRYTWSTKNRMVVSIITYGATIISIKTPSKTGKIADIIWGFDTLEEYMSPRNQFYFGATIGRVANIIPNASYKYLHDFFELRANICNPYDVYDSRAQYNGGRKGFDKFIWKSYVDKTKVYMTHIDKHGTEGYPGKVFTTICFEVMPTNELHIEMKTTTTLTTPISLTNCLYFNLGGHGSGPKRLHDHLIDINACRYCETDDRHYPTGKVARVCGTIFDIRIPHGIGELLMKGPCEGYDHNMCITHDDVADLDYAGRLYYPETGRMIEVYSDQPGLQFSTCDYIPGDRVEPVDNYDPQLLIPPIKTEEIGIQCNLDEEENAENDSCNEETDSSESKTSVPKPKEVKPRSEWAQEEWASQFVVDGVCRDDCPCAMTDEIRLELFLNSQMLDEEMNEGEDKGEEESECLPECPGICKQIQKICEEQKLTDEQNKLALQRALGRSCLDETGQRPCKNPLQEMKCDRPESKRGPCGTSVEQILAKLPSEPSLVFEPSGDYIPGKDGAKYVCNGAVLLQTQKYPDALHNKNFPSIILRPGEVYKHRIKYVFGIQIICEDENPDEVVEKESSLSSGSHRFDECLKKTCKEYFDNLVADEQEEMVMVDATTQTSLNGVH